MTRKVFLILLALALALSAGLVGCAGGPVGEEEEEEETYELTVTSTAGGAVSPWGTTTHAAGTVIDLEAVAAFGFVFVNWTGDTDTVADINDPFTTITYPGGDAEITANFEFNPPPPVEVPDYPVIMVAAGGFHTVGLKADGTVVATGDNEYGQCDVGDWEGIVQIAAGVAHTVGLREDGTVIAAGNNEYGQCDCPGWNAIVQIAAGISFTVGLREDGTVVAVGDSAWWQPSAGFCLIPPCPGPVAPVEDITQIAAGATHIVALREDGTVIAAGNNAYGQCDCPGWNAIVQIAAGVGHTVALREDRTVIAVGNNEYGQCDVPWNLAVLQAEDPEEEEEEPIQAYPNPLVQIAAGGFHTVGLEGVRGTVIAVGDNEYGQCDVEDWTNIAYVSAGYQHTVAIRNDGSVVAVGNNDHGQCDCPGWNMCPGWN
jgi:alpha-tubulin suppressor-like RCC1 family protein